MTDGDALLQRYVRACDAVIHDTSGNPPQWPIADTKEFAILRDLFTPLAESGDVHSQYALACIYYMGYCCESQEEFLWDYETTMQTATHWLIAAARQGHWFALGNLLSVGVGGEADRVRVAAEQFRKERSDLLVCDPDTKAPLYFWEYQQELCRTIYSRVIDLWGSDNAYSLRLYQ